MKEANRQTVVQFAAELAERAETKEVNPECLFDCDICIMERQRLKGVLIGYFTVLNLRYFDESEEERQQRIDTIKQKLADEIALNCRLFRKMRNGK